MKKYIHVKSFSEKNFKKELFEEIKNYFVKPKGGFWGSPVECEISWKDWCEENSPEWVDGKESYEFTLKEDANILYFRTIDDIKKLFKEHKEWFDYSTFYGVQHNVVIERLLEAPESRPYMFPNIILDFERMLADGVDAIEIDVCAGLYDIFYGWDCDSILVMNPDVIIIHS